MDNYEGGLEIIDYSENMKVLYIVLGFGIYFVPNWWLNVKNLKLFPYLFGGYVERL